MKQLSAIVLILTLALFFTACEQPDQTAETAPTVPTETAEPSTGFPDATTAPPATASKPEHSELYIPGLSAEDVISYFNEVCLDAEYINSGNASLLQKWTAPIGYTLQGDYTEEDAAVVHGFTDWLNTVEGFPGIYETDDANAVLRIYFCTQEEMLDRMGASFSGLDGAVTFWYRDNEIYDAIICCRTDLDQTLRNSVILEEMYNGLGPIQDTSLRPDSIIAQEYAQPQELTETDELILKLLYHPQLQCGMDAAVCEVVIRQLYY